MGRNLAKTYDPKSFEDRIYEMWEEHGSFIAASYSSLMSAIS